MSIMTPQPAGYPDYQAYPGWRTPNLLPAGSGTWVPGTTPAGTIITQNFAAVEFFCGPTAGYGVAQLDWYNDAALTQHVWQDEWTIATWGSLRVIVPSRAAYCQASVTVQSPGNMTLFPELAGVNMSSGRLTYPVAVRFISTGLVSQPAGSNSVFPFGTVLKGLGMVSFRPSDNTGNLVVRLVIVASNQTGSTILADLGSPSGAINQQIALPDNQCGIQVLNVAATAAHSFTLEAVAGV